MDYSDVFKSLELSRTLGLDPEVALREVLMTESKNKPYNHDKDSLSDACGVDFKEMTDIINDLPVEEYPSQANSELCELSEKLYLRHGRVGLAAAFSVTFKLIMSSRIKEKIGSELREHLATILKSGSGLSDDSTEGSSESDKDPIKGIKGILGKFFR